MDVAVLNIFLSPWTKSKAIFISGYWLNNTLLLWHWLSVQLDGGITYEHLGEKLIEGRNYDIVKITFDLNGKPATDIYQLYINKETSLVDQFLFTVADFNVMETPYLMKLEYEDIDGILLPTQRKYKKSNWNAEVTEEPWILVTWSDIKFNNGLTKKDFKK